MRLVNVQYFNSNNETAKLLHLHKYVTFLDAIRVNLRVVPNLDGTGIVMKNQNLRTLILPWLYVPYYLQKRHKGWT